MGLALGSGWVWVLSCVADYEWIWAARFSGLAVFGFEFAFGFLLGFMRAGVVSLLVGVLRFACCCGF